MLLVPWLSEIHPKVRAYKGHEVYRIVQLQISASNLGKVDETSSCFDLVFGNDRDDLNQPGKH